MRRVLLHGGRVDETSVQNLVAATVKDMGKVDILVCAQGFNKKFDAQDFPMDVFRQMLDVNVTGFMMCGKHFGKHMMENKYGKIVLLSSVRAKSLPRVPATQATAPPRAPLIC
jgi:gluconate 5-dehydrogenase